MPDSSPSPDFAGLIDNRGRMDEVWRLRRGNPDLHGLAILAQRLFAGLQNFQYLHAVPSIGSGHSPVGHAAKEMFTLVLEGFGVFERESFSAIFERDWHAIEPVDAMRIQSQFSVSFNVVENHHAFVADNRQFLLFEGVDPTHKDVRLNTTRKMASRHRRVEYLGVHITAPVGRNAFRSFAEQRTDH